MTEVRDKWTQRTAADYAQAFNHLLPTGLAWPRDAKSPLQKTVKGLSGVWGDPIERLAALLLTLESDPRKTVVLLPDWERAWGLPDRCLAEPLTISDRQHALVAKMTLLGGQSRQFFIALAASIGYQIRIHEYAPFMAGVSQCGDTTGIGGKIGESSAVGTGFLVGPMTIMSPVSPDMPLIIGDGVRFVSRSSGQWFEGYVTAYSGNTLTYTGTTNSGDWFDIFTLSIIYKDDFNIMRIDDPRWQIGAPEMRFYWTVAVANARLSWFRAASGQAGVDPHLRIGIATDLECLLRRYKPSHTEIVFDYSGLVNGGPMAGTP